MVETEIIDVCQHDIVDSRRRRDECRLRVEDYRIQ